MTCRRFYVITRAESNRHFFYMAVVLGWESADIVDTVSRLHASLRESKGCDIHLDVWIQPLTNSKRILDTRLLLHVVNMMRSYTRQLGSINLKDSTNDSTIASWLFRWIATGGPYPRLQSLNLFRNLAPSNNETETSLDFHLYKSPGFNNNNPETFTDTQCLQSLTYIELAGHFGPASETLWFPILCSAKYLETLSLYPGNYDTTGDSCDWNVIYYILTSCRTLKTLEIVLQNCLVAPESNPDPVPIPKSSNLTLLQIITDTSSLHTLFTTCHFPYLRECSIAVIPDPPSRRADNSRQFCSRLDLPSLRTLAFLDSSTDDTHFMENCVAPSLEKLTIRSGPFWTSLKEDWIVNLSPRSLTIGLGSGLSIDDQLRPLNLTFVEELTIAVCEEHEENEASSVASTKYHFSFTPFDPVSAEKAFVDRDAALGGPNSSGTIPDVSPGSLLQQTPRRHALPRLKSVSLYGIGPLSGALWWLERHFRLPSKSTLTIDSHYIVDFASSTSAHAAPDLIQMTSEYKPRRLEMPSTVIFPPVNNFQLFNTIGMAFRHAWFDYEAVKFYFGRTKPTAKAINDDDYHENPLFSELRDIRLSVFHPRQELRRQDWENKILRVIGRVEDRYGRLHFKTSLPHLESLTLTYQYKESLLDDERHVKFVEQAKDRVNARMEGGYSLVRVEIIYLDNDGRAIHETVVVPGSSYDN